MALYSSTESVVPLVGVVTAFGTLLAVLVRALLQQGGAWRMIITTKTQEYDLLRAEMHAQEARCRAEVETLSHELAEARRQVDTLRLQVAELQRNAERGGIP